MTVHDPTRSPEFDFTAAEAHEYRSLVVKAKGAQRRMAEILNAARDRARSEPEPWTPTFGEEEQVTLEGVVNQAVGAAAACWEDLGGAGMFDDRKAAAVAGGLVRWLVEHPMLVANYGAVGPKPAPVDLRPDVAAAVVTNLVGVDGRHVFSPLPTVDDKCAVCGAGPGGLHVPDPIRERAEAMPPIQWADFPDDPGDDPYAGVAFRLAQAVRRRGC